MYIILCTVACNRAGDRAPCSISVTAAISQHSCFDDQRSPKCQLLVQARSWHLGLSPAIEQGIEHPARSASPLPSRSTAASMISGRQSASSSCKHEAGTLACRLYQNRKSRSPPSRIFPRRSFNISSTFGFVTSARFFPISTSPAAFVSGAA